MGTIALHLDRPRQFLSGIVHVPTGYKYTAAIPFHLGRISHSKKYAPKKLSE